LERAYEYVLAHGLADMSLRPLATAVGSSPRVLLVLFGSKDGLVRALVARARADELALLQNVSGDPQRDNLAILVRTTWGWLSEPRHRPLLALWLEAYARSLIEPAGPWSGFARQTVADWLAILAGTRPSQGLRSANITAQHTLALAVLRGALLDLLATGDRERVGAALEEYLLDL